MEDILFLSNNNNTEVNINKSKLIVQNLSFTGKSKYKIPFDIAM